MKSVMKDIIEKRKKDSRVQEQSDSLKKMPAKNQPSPDSSQNSAKKQSDPKPSPNSNSNINSKPSPSPTLAPNPSSSLSQSISKPLQSSANNHTSPSLPQSPSIPHPIPSAIQQPAKNHFSVNLTQSSSKNQPNTSLPQTSTEKQPDPKKSRRSKKDQIKDRIKKFPKKLTKKSSSSKSPQQSTGIQASPNTAQHLSAKNQSGAKAPHGKGVNNLKKPTSIIALGAIGVAAATAIVLLLVNIHKQNEAGNGNVDSNNRELPKMEGDIQLKDYTYDNNDMSISVAIDSSTKQLGYIRTFKCEEEGCVPATESGSATLTQEEFDKAKLIREEGSKEGSNPDITTDWALALEAIARGDEVMVKKTEIEDAIWTGTYEAYDENKDGTVTQREWGSRFLNDIISSFGLSSD